MCVSDGLASAPARAHTACATVWCHPRRSGGEVQLRRKCSRSAVLRSAQVLALRLAIAQSTGTRRSLFKNYVLALRNGFLIFRITTAR